MDLLRLLVEYCVAFLEFVGMAVIILGAGYATGGAVLLRAKGETGGKIFENYRQQLGRSIILGLEFLVAADIISTVAIKPTLQGLAVLASIVLIRTFLSFVLEVETTGRWPWQGGVEDAQKDGGKDGTVQ
jgi:uncharacterized membrane protein